MWQHLGKLRTTLAVLRKFIARPQHRRVRPDERITLPADDRRRQRLAFVLREHGLVVEHFELRRRTRHKHVDHRLGLRLEMCRRGDIRTLPSAIGRLRQQRSQRDLARADSTVLEEMTTGDVGSVHDSAVLIVCWHDLQIPVYES